MDNPIRRGAAPADPAALVDFEASIGHPLPDEYRSFLLAHNGGVPRRTAFRYTLSSGQPRKARVEAFAPVSADGWDEVACPPLPLLWELDGGEPIDGTVAIGAAETDNNRGTIRLGVAGEAAGRVFFRPADTARDRLYPVAKSWGEFLAGLTPAAKPAAWDVAIEDGDVAALRAWIDGHRRKWNDYLTRCDIERKAVAENQPAILDLLVGDYGLEADSVVKEALDADRLGLARHFLARAAESGPDSLRSALNRPGPYLWHAPALVEALLDAGAEAAHEEGDGMTPLHHAAQAGAAESVRLLLARGADPALASDDEQTPLQLAERGEWHEVAALLRDALAHRVDPDAGEAVRPFDLHGVGFVRTGTPITLDEVRAVEAALKMPFPPEYRWLLLQANGAILRPGQMPADAFPELYQDDDEDDEDEEHDDDRDEEDPEIRLDLFPLRQSDCPEGEQSFGDGTPSLTCSAQEMAGWYHDGSEIPRGFLPIGGLEGYGCEGSGFLLLGCRGASRGRLVAFDYHRRPLGIDLPGLFERLARVGRRPKSPAERLADAVEAGDLDAVRAAVAEGAATSRMTRDGRMPARAACEAGFDAAVELIGEHGDRGWVITEALMAGRVAAARRLFDGAPKLKKDTLRDMLMYPALYSDVEFLARVIDRGIRLDKLFNDPHGVSPVEIAAASGSVAGLTLLLERGGKLDKVDPEQGTTLLHDAVRHPEHDLGEMIPFLLARGVPRDAGDYPGHTALHQAIKANHVGAAKALIDAGASMSFRATRYDPWSKNPKARKMLDRVNKEMEKFAREMGRDFPELDDALTAEDAPVLDPDDPQAQQAIRMAEAAGQIQAAMAKMIPNVAKSIEEQNQSLGPPAADLARTCPYPHIPALVAELIRYEAERRPT